MSVSINGTTGLITAGASSSGGGGVASNTALGGDALVANTTGASNTAIGNEALKANTTASFNTAVGYTSGYTTTTGTRNTSVGAQALYTNSTGEYNCAYGLNSLQSATTASLNTCYGYNSGSAITTGAKNSILGSYNGNQGSLDIRTASNYIVLSDGDGNPKLISDTSGNTYVGTYPPGYIATAAKFTVSQANVNWDASVFANIMVDSQTAFNSDPKPGIVFGLPYTASASATGVSIQAFKVNATSGDFGQGFRITTQGNGLSPSYKMTIDGVGNIGAPSGTNIYNASDVRLKKNIKTLDNSLDKINALRGVEFNWIDNFCEAENNKILYGFVAQEVEGVDENLIDPFGTAEIKVDDLTVDNPIRVNEKFIIPLLVNAIKELNAKVDTQAAEIAALKAAP
jgi:hypothetical protein